MEFPTNINKYLKINEQGFFICSGRTLNKLIQPNFVNEGTKMINEILNELGERSAKSQGLKQIITSAIKFNGSDHRVYLKVQGNKAIGFLRTGQKKLFYHDNIGKMKELTPTCVLDIYVHENYQRSGVGKQIFETFLKCENKRPQKLAYDRPSPKLFGFLKKHYGLSKFIPQNNNFVIFDQYFMSLPETMKTSSNQSQNINEKLKKTSTNKFYKYENKPETTMQSKPLVQTRGLNRTVGNISQQKNEVTKKREQKIEDTLSLLEKQINRLHLKTPPVANQSKDLCRLSKQVLETLEPHQKIDQNKIHAYINYAPWATTSDSTFRTTSNSYGNYYKNK